MKELLTFLLAFLCYTTNATNYYFSSSGKDSYTINSSVSAWKSLSKLNSLTLKAGDKVLFKSGDTLYGSIVTKYDGTYSSPIIFDIYGGTVPAVISGTTAINHITYVGSGIWRTDTLKVQSDVRNVIMDGVQLEQGRYPNDYPNTGGYLVYENYLNGDSSTVIFSQQLSQYGIDSSWAGATLKVKSYLSTLESGKILNIQGNTLSFDNRNMFYQLGRTNCGYFVTNSIKTLDKVGEWWYNPKDRRVYIFFGVHDAPSLHKIEVSTTDAIFQDNNNSYSLNNISFWGANKYGIKAATPNKHDLRLYNVKVLNSGITAIAIANLSSIHMTNITVDGANTTGINVGFNCDSVYLIKPVINNIGMLVSNIYCDSSYQKRMGMGVYSGSCKTKGIYIENGKITNIAYDGIFFTGSNNFIYRNYIANTCMYLDDGGGIYYGGWKTYTGYNNFVRRNIIINCKGYWYGYPSFHTIPNAFFVDDNGTNITADSNYIAGSGQSCVYIHNGYNCTLVNNTFTNAALSLIIAQDDTLGGRVYNLNIRNNDLLVTDTNQLIYCLYGSGNATDNYLTQYGIIDYNYIATPNVLYNGRVAHADTFSVRGVADFSLPQWKANMPYDHHSIGVDIRGAITQSFYAIEDSTIFLQGTWQRLNGMILKDTALKMKNHTGIILIKKP